MDVVAPEFAAVDVDSLLWHGDQDHDDTKNVERNSVAVLENGPCVC